MDPSKIAKLAKMELTNGKKGEARVARPDRKLAFPIDRVRAYFREEEEESQAWQRFTLKDGEDGQYLASGGAFQWQTFVLSS